MLLRPLHLEFSATRGVARRIGAHVMSRARQAAVGRIDLAPFPGGIGTPCFGPDHRVIRLDGGRLIVESTADTATTRSMTVSGATLADLGTFAGVDFTDDLDVGHDTPPLGDVDAVLAIDAGSVAQLGEWFAFGLQVMDVVAGTSPASAAPSRARIWPEHFDLGIDLAAADGSRLNLGASPGDAFHDAPYLYVAPWDSVRPGDSHFWNAPFGAIVGYEDLIETGGPVAAGAAFFVKGIHRFG